MTPPAAASSQALEEEIREYLVAQMPAQCAPPLLRLAFHDAGTYDVNTHTGGAHGAIHFLEELARPENTGWSAACVALLAEVKGHYPLLSWADLVALAGAALAVAVTPVAAVAQEQQQAPPAKTAEPLGSVHRVSKSEATLKVRYSCKAGNTLWISLKQSKSGKKDARLKKEGSSKYAHTWLQSHRNTVKCDGKKHTKTFTVDKVEPGSKGRLKAGRAWLQFCVTNVNQLTVSVAGWVKVA